MIMSADRNGPPGSGPRQSLRPFKAPVPAWLEPLRESPIRALLKSASELDRAIALDEGHGRELTLEDIARILVSRHAPATEDLVAMARAQTDATFGRRILLYAPCYLSSFCVNHCLYCGFNFTRDVERRHLAPREVEEEVSVLAGWGMRRILLVASENPALVTRSYLSDAISRTRQIVPQVDLEVPAADQKAYEAWVRAGASGVTCYQETYDEAAYRPLHPRGPKSFFEYRLGTLERAAEAGMGRLGMGILLDLADPYFDLLALVAHARFLESRYPAAMLTVSLPRLRPAVHDFQPAFVVDADSLVRFYAILRLALPRAGLVASTRESAKTRRALVAAGVTQMSAGSVTVPGGYSHADHAAVQFDVSDHRTVDEVIVDLVNDGYSIRWN
jgi:2-iminoacetate synthase